MPSHNARHACAMRFHADEVKCIRKWQIYVCISWKQLNQLSGSNADVSQIKMPPKKLVFEPYYFRHFTAYFLIDKHFKTYFHFCPAKSKKAIKHRFYFQVRLMNVCAKYSICNTKCKIILKHDFILYWEQMGHTDSLC